MTQIIKIWPFRCEVAMGCLGVILPALVLGEHPGEESGPNLFGVIFTPWRDAVPQSSGNKVLCEPQLCTHVQGLIAHVFRGTALWCGPSVPEGVHMPCRLPVFPAFGTCAGKGTSMWNLLGCQELCLSTAPVATLCGMLHSGKEVWWTRSSHFERKQLELLDWIDR
ncbi:hypothetical protein F5J12DRAFT_785128 [Pisolithus orientalis]|uniref:uncharacterized protein n=1 Tax=Pisolithus orientalis TaxID=936130 RepID=UPI0022250C63|nr:uncharacterized protein F5J12DRAFT_785128 [Pisolithus orientalis]KAI5997664.1 hypothetical protein F5J12DRAFT_785128 [Pisolithus orientalis]